MPNGVSKMSKLYLTYDWNEDHKAYIGVITDKHPQKEDNGVVTVLSVELAGTIEELQHWFKECSKTRPWETRQ